MTYLPFAKGPLLDDPRFLFLGLAPRGGLVELSPTASPLPRDAAVFFTQGLDLNPAGMRVQVTSPSMLVLRN